MSPSQPDMMMSVSDGGDAFVEVYTKLIEGTSPKRIRMIERTYSLSFIGRGTTRLAFRAGNYVPEGSPVVKIAIPGQAGRRAVEREADLWRKANDSQRNLLTPVLDEDDQNHWLLMPELDVGVEPTHAHDLHQRLTTAGMAMRDVTPGDIGIRNNDHMLVDYAGCKFIKNTPVTQNTMEQIVEQRWDGWNDPR
jgi:hypothetical protein